MERSGRLPARHPQPRPRAHGRSFAHEIFPYAYSRPAQSARTCGFKSDLKPTKSVGGRSKVLPRCKAGYPLIVRKPRRFGSTREAARPSIHLKNSPRSAQLCIIMRKTLTKEKRRETNDLTDHP